MGSLASKGRTKKNYSKGVFDLGDPTPRIAGSLDAIELFELCYPHVFDLPGLRIVGRKISENEYFVVVDYNFRSIIRWSAIQEEEGIKILLFTLISEEGEYVNYLQHNISSQDLYKRSFEAIKFFNRRDNDKKKTSNERKREESLIEKIFGKEEDS
jgi:hypothetical protein